MPKSKPFDQYSERYDKWYDKNEKVFESEVKAIKSIYSFNGKGIEIGLGSGRFAGELGIENGLEPSKNMRELARSRGINVMDGQAENIPESDQSYRYCLMVNTICFLDDVNKAFSEANRILKDGGIFIIGFINEESQLGKKYQKEKKNNVFYRRANLFSIEELSENLSSHNFKIQQTVQTLFKNIDDLQEVQPVRNGYGEGGFVVIKAKKIN